PIPTRKCQASKVGEFRTGVKRLWSSICSGSVRWSHNKLSEGNEDEKRVLLLSAAGIAAGLVYAFESNRSKRRTSQELAGDFEQDTSTARTENGKTSIETEPHELDDHGTNQADALHILKEIRDAAFDASNEKLALALGRPTEEIVQGINGEALI